MERLERRRGVTGAEDFHYNGGDIPLSHVMFGNSDYATHRKLKWVFTIDGNASPRFVEMMKVAVHSALKNTRLVPFCVHMGSLSNEATSFLKQVGVHIIHHEPAWKHRITEAFHRQTGFQTLQSTNYLDPHKMLATFVRFDIPLLGFVDKYLLYADVDVMFVRPLTLIDFEPLPAVYAVGTEAADKTTIKDGSAFGNAGVMLLNLAAMRSTHGRFVTWTFSPKHIKNALSFGKYGPLDQGAYNDFYQGHFDTHRSPAFNWKPYWGKSPGEGHEKLIHFHGPKPLEYIEHVNNPAGVSNPAISDLLQLCDQSSGCYEWVDLWLWYYNDSRMLNDAP